VAAATGSLPGPAQGAAHDALSAAGIQVPDDGSGSGTTTATTTGETVTSEVTTTTVDPATSPSEPAGDQTDGAEGAPGPDPTGPAKHGLCTAYAAGQGGQHGAKLDSTAFRALIDAAGAADQTVEEFCADAAPGGRATPDTTTVTTEVATTTPIPTGSGPATAGANGHGSPHGSAVNRGAAASGHTNPHHG
jgi:hypothetical protein